MFLLTIALRVFTLIEFVVHEALQEAQRVLTGLYDGNSKRATARPFTEQLLKAFCNLTFYSLPDSTIFVTPLSDLQRQILSLMSYEESHYWFAKISNGKRSQALKAIRVLLGD
ncbi:MAG: hypothetical protein HEQ24_19890 [Dolichospermum sp. BR01]|nr:hypothetical protein [Dolichospermum sp. BR01]